MTTPPGKITRKDVALAAGVSTYTVSQVMANRAGPSQRTRERVLRVAKQLGYTPDLAASILSSRHRPAAKKRFKIGYLQRRRLGYLQNLLSGAAIGLDIDAEIVDLSRFPSPAAAGKTLYNLGFDGLLITSNSMPWSPDERRQFPWEKFALIKLDRACPDIRCNIIRHSAFDFAHCCLENICALGCKNIAVVLIETVSAHDDDARFGAVYNFRERKLPPGARLSVHLSASPPDAPLTPETLRWLRRLKPDVAVFFHRGMAEAYLKQTAPAERCPSVAAFHVEADRFSNPFQIAGCLTGAAGRYEIALHQLVDLIRHNRKGFGKYTSETVIEPEWFPGETLRPPAPSRGGIPAKTRAKIRASKSR